MAFTLDEMRAPLEATDRLDSVRKLSSADREELMTRKRGQEQAAQQRMADLRAQLARAEEFADLLGWAKLP